MSFQHSANGDRSVAVLKKSLLSGRVGHAYLFSSDTIAEVESVAVSFAQALNCVKPLPRSSPHEPCGQCRSCDNVAKRTHVDVHWVRPESKSRVITVDQMRDLMGEVFLKPTEGGYKIAVIVSADRLNKESANAFLKTLEEPPDKSVILLLTTEPARVLETIRSRCLRLPFEGSGEFIGSSLSGSCVQTFAQAFGGSRVHLLGRYEVLSRLLKDLAGCKAEIEALLLAKSPLTRYEEADPKVRAQWEDDLKAMVESEYRHQRAQILLAIQWWLRDVWLESLKMGGHRLAFPDEVPFTRSLANRITADEALVNVGILEKLQRQLLSNVQELLALEVALLQLHG